MATKNFSRPTSIPAALGLITSRLFMAFLWSQERPPPAHRKEDKPTQRQARLTKQDEGRGSGTNLIDEQPLGAAKENRLSCDARSRNFTLSGSREPGAKIFRGVLILIVISNSHFRCRVGD